MFPEPTELRLIGCSIEFTWTQKTKSSTSTPKTNLPTCQPREILHVTNGIIFCVCSILAISVLQFVLKRWQKRRKSHSEVKTNDEFFFARAPSTLSSSASESPGKRSYECQSPWSAKAEKADRTGQPVVDLDVSSARYSRWDDDKAWSSQEWKADKSTDERTGQPVVTSWAKTHESQSRFSHGKTQHVILDEEEPHDGTGQPVVYAQREARPQQFIIGDDETESELSLGSRSFLNRVNDQVRKRQKRSSMNVTEDGEKHSVLWGMFMSSTLESSVFMGKNYSDNWHSITNTKDLTMKQMFDITARLVSEQDEISGVETIGWKNSSWKYLSLIGDERVINLQRTKVHVFSDSVLCLGKIFENSQSNDAWEERLGWFKSSPEYRNFDRINGEPTEFEWNIFTGFNTLQLSQ